MMTRRSGIRLFAWIVIPGLLLVTTGCFFNLSEEKNFQSWYFGEPGMAGALGEKRCDPYADRIQGERHPYYLHFRTLEVLYQPQGGGHYPERSTVTALDAEGGRTAYACEIVAEGRETFNFNAVDAGLVDVMIPFRKATAVADEGARSPGTGSYASSVATNAGIAAAMKAPVYLVHDVLKTLYLPVAGTYFLLRTEEAPESGPDGPEAAPDLASGEGAAPAPSAAAAAASAESEARTSEAASAPSPAVPMDDALIADAKEESDAPSPALETTAVGDALPPSASEAAPADANAAPTTTIVPDKGAATAEPPAPTESAPADPAAAESRDGGQAPPAAEPPSSAQARAGAIQEEELTEPLEALTPNRSAPAAPAATRPEDNARAADRTTVPPALTDGGDAADARDASVEQASVAEGRQALADSPQPVPVLEEVAVSRRDLIKQVAVLKVISRQATVDSAVKALFEERMLPALTEECSRRVDLLYSGDPRFPDALKQLSRDQFGRLNSFEVTTLARLSGINAVVTGTIIDVRLSNEISGVLWYKAPEGLLRVAVLVEVYDAETGTKLLDKTLVHETEVEEVAPGGDGRLRDEDLVFVQMALDAIAADMSDLVCEVLEDQPWRAFVTGVEGARITLSAGTATGLAPGQVLAVYNSQIIEGLNNQQFFLTGERVGRLQITRVHPDHAEARVIEGADHINSYSLVLPEG